MKRTLFLIATIICGIGLANAAVRDTNSPKRTLQQANQARQTTRVVRSAPARSAVTKSVQTRTAVTTPNDNRKISTRPQSIQNEITSRKPINKPTIEIKSRAASTLITPASNTFNAGYATCREAYFTCMDQFCGNLDDTYRRCICSSKISEVQSRERALSQTSDQIQDFKTFNMYTIDKSAAEVSAMVNASAGEIAQETTPDKSDSAATLSSIGEILSKSQSNNNESFNFSTNINTSWNTSDLIGNNNISNLTGEALYNTVNAQCLEMISSICPNQTTVQMVTAAYGMYIENDCSLLISNLDSKKKTANSEIRKTEREMGTARLDNYNTHNSSGINECLALIRQDITAETACGPDYIHCLDITGKYLNYQTGDPIYTPDFYELATATSLTGEILENNVNNSLIAQLNDKKIFAKQSLDTCRDLSDYVWDEFLRQAIAEIHQEQQKRVRQVKNECLVTVVSCYEYQAGQLADYSDIDTQNLLGMRLELSESMCQDKLNACSNLYGGGAHGMQELLSAMHDIVSEQIANNCKSALEKFAKTLCSPPQYDVLHSYPFECRAYAPGNEICATKTNYADDKVNCEDYNGSLYQKLAQHALENCVRPSELTNELPASVLQDVSEVISDIHVKMHSLLASECEKYDGIWLQYDINPKKSHTKNMKFYSQTPAHEKWGTCVAQ